MGRRGPVHSGSRRRLKKRAKKGPRGLYGGRSWVAGVPVGGRSRCWWSLGGRSGAGWGTRAGGCVAGLLRRLVTCGGWSWADLGGVGGRAGGGIRGRRSGSVGWWRSAWAAAGLGRDDPAGRGGWLSPMAAGGGLWSGRARRAGTCRGL